MKEKLLYLSELKPELYCLYITLEKIYIICLEEQSVNFDP